MNNDRIISQIISETKIWIKTSHTWRDDDKGRS